MEFIIFSSIFNHAMQLSSKRFWILLQLLIITLVLLYQAMWLSAETSRAKVEGFSAPEPRRDPNKLRVVYVSYQVNYSNYEADYYVINPEWFGQEYLNIKYLPFAPGWSRPAGSFAAWYHIKRLLYIQLFIASLILLFPNALVPKGSSFILQRKLPLIRLLKGTEWSAGYYRSRAVYFATAVQQVLMISLPVAMVFFVAYIASQKQWLITAGICTVSAAGLWKLFQWRKKNSIHSFFTEDTSNLQSQTKTRFIKANFTAGLIEQFMLPMVICCFLGLFAYVFSGFKLIVLIAAGSIGAALGGVRANKWKKKLETDDSELKAVIKLSNGTDVDDEVDD